MHTNAHTVNQRRHLRRQPLTFMDDFRGSLFPTNLSILLSVWKRTMCASVDIKNGPFLKSLNVTIYVNKHSEEFGHDRNKLTASKTINNTIKSDNRIAIQVQCRTKPSRSLHLILVKEYFIICLIDLYFHFSYPHNYNHAC